ncbi:hypothetical protein Tco_0886019 [Tanacetum coccineum]
MSGELLSATDIGDYLITNGREYLTKLKNLFEKLTEITIIVDPNSSTGEDKLGNKSDVQDNQNKNDTDSEVEECGCLEYSGSEPRPKTIGGNAQSERHLLWAELGLHKLAVRGLPWVLMGDFNVVLNMEDIYAGASSLNSAMYDFKDCVAKIEVMDINSAGLHYTWNQKPKGGNGVLKKLDHIMGNLEFMDCFPGAFAIFQPYRISDHSHVVLKFPNLASSMPKPFKFFNFLAYKSKFMEVVACNWNVNMEGHNMFKVVSKLKRLKKTMRKLLHDHGNLHDRVNKLRVEIDEERFLNYRPPRWSVKLPIRKLKPLCLILAMIKPRVPMGIHPLSLKRDGMSLAVMFVMCKILTIRIIEGIKEVVSDNQSAFVPGRRISDNILITQELMHNYHRIRGPLRCVFKVDIQKAYDTVDWAFLENILVCFGFTNTMIRWIMVCVCPLLRSPFVSMVISIDDIFIFARGDVESARVILDSFEEFKLTSSLVPSIPKSTAYFCNVLHHIKQAILNIMPFSEVELPVKYLGVPLISSRLLNKDCKILVEKAKNRRKAKVAWEDICLPKWEGGLGLRNLDIFNIALLTTHIWNIVSNKESLWVRWIHTYKLKGRSLWDIPLQSNLSWGWLKLLQIRDLVRPFIWIKIGNGVNTSICMELASILDPKGPGTWAARSSFY